MYRKLLQFFYKKNLRLCVKRQLTRILWKGWIFFSCKKSAILIHMYVHVFVIDCFILFHISMKVWTIFEAMKFVKIGIVGGHRAKGVSSQRYNQVWNSIFFLSLAYPHITYTSYISTFLHFCVPFLSLKPLLHIHSLLWCF